MHNFDSGSSEYSISRNRKRNSSVEENMRCQNHKLLDIILNKENYKKKLLFTNRKNTMKGHRC